MLRYGNVIFIIFWFLFFSSCSDDRNIPDTPTSGEIKIFADNTLQYVIPPQLDLFSSIYKNSKVTYGFKSEQECIDALLNNSCKLIVISRNLSAKELKTFENKNLIIQQTPLAYTAIILIGQPFREKGITVDELKNILSGNSKYQIIFFRNLNGVVWYCKDSLLAGKDFGKNCFSVNDTTEFRKYIFENDNTIGIIDYSFICDDDGKWIRNLKYPGNDTMLIPVRKKEHSSAYYPDQSNIATKDYPLTRVLYCIRRGDDFSLSAGIEAFLAGEKGQILFKKMGLVPVIDRERRIEMKPY